ncbi:MAG: lipoyl(octanoyl) transferase LipB [bacterium]
MNEIREWGLIEYNEAWQKQREIVEEIRSDRKKNVFVMCQHPSVITIGRNGTEDNIVINPDFLEKQGISVVKNDRGGDVTLHNPGQLVGYPIFNLENYKKDLHWFLREIENSIIELLSGYGIKADVLKGLTGVWINGKRKICAMGLHCSDWITSHGFALNVNNNLEEFNYIIPCGIRDKEVTSIAKEIGMDIDFNLVENKCKEVFENRFG